MNLKRYSFLFLFVICCCSTNQAHAQADQTITLTDGSVLKGQLIGATENNIMIKTANMGTVTVAQDQVREISRQTSGNPGFQQENSGFQAMEKMGGDGSASMANSQQFQQMQSMLMSNPKIIQAIQELLKDPEILALLEDPSLANAVQGGADPMSLMSNPAFMKILGHPKIQAAVQDAAMELMNQGMLSPQ